MRVRIEIGSNAGRGCIEIYETKTIKTDNFRTLYRQLKRDFIKKEKIVDEDTIDYLNEFSDIDEEEEGAFYIGFEEGEYIEGWILI